VLLLRPAMSNGAWAPEIVTLQADVSGSSRALTGVRRGQGMNEMCCREIANLANA